MIHNEHINANLDLLSGDCKFEHAEGLYPNDFCLNFHEEGHYTAEVCEKVPNKYRYRNITSNFHIYVIYYINQRNSIQVLMMLQSLL